MIRHLSRVALVIVTTFLLTTSVVGQHDKVDALFELGSIHAAPFPTDWFTVPDASQNTGRRVAMPLGGCQPSECEDLALINELDGFNLQPRISIPFSGAVDVNTVTGDTVFLVSLGSTVPAEDEMPWGTVIGIDQIVWDTLTDTLYVESDSLLAQHTRFALIVTDGVRDQRGARVKSSDAFERFRASGGGDYKHALLDAMHAVRRGVGLEEDEVVVASVFTTGSATAVLEKISGQIHEATPDPADFLLGSSGQRTVFNLADVTGAQGIDLSPTSPLRTIFPGAVGSVAFGKYLSPDYEVHPGEYIPAVGTRTGTPAVQDLSAIYFNVFLPSGPAPAAGWPVAIFGHGNNNNKNVLPLQVASSMARHGIATIAINAVGHGGNPLATISITRAVGGAVTLPAGGRGIDQDGNGVIGTNEGAVTRAPRSLLFFSDGIRQTAADLMQLVRIIEIGLDADGDGRAELDPSRIYYLGNSLGAGSGTVFLAVEPHVRAGVLSGPVDPPALTQALQFRAFTGGLLGARLPTLLNHPGVTTIDGRTFPTFPPVGGQLYPFDENRPLRSGAAFSVGLEDSSVRLIQSPVNNDVAGAMAIQEGFDRMEWVSQAGGPVAYAPHIQKAPLSGNPAKAALYQIAKGDEAAPNPTTTAILRAGGFTQWTYYLHELYRSTLFPTLTRNPHTFAVSVTGVNANMRPISLGVQQQAAQFFLSDGTSVIQPEPSAYLELRNGGDWPEQFNYIP